MSNEAIAHVSWYVLGYILNYENFVVQLLSSNQHPRLPGTEFCKNPVKVSMSTTFEGGTGLVCSKNRSRQGLRGSCPANEPAREEAFPDDFIDSSVVSGGGLVVSKRGLVVSKFSTMSLYIMKIVILKQLKLPKQPSFAYITKKVAVACLVFVYLSPCHGDIPPFQTG